MEKTTDTEADVSYRYTFPDQKCFRHRHLPVNRIFQGWLSCIVLEGKHLIPFLEGREKKFWNSIYDNEGEVKTELICEDRENTREITYKPLFRTAWVIT